MNETASGPHDLRSVASAPRPLVAPRTTLLVLLLTTAILLLGSGLFGTLLGVRAGLEGIATGMVGLIMSAYFAGFVVGTFLCVDVARRVGHIRAFAAFAAIVATMALAHAIWVAVLPWLVFRFVSGVALAGLALVIESWLNAQTPPERRGRTFALYMAVNLSAVAFGQLLLTAADPADFVLFAAVAMLFALSLVPTALVRVEAPMLHAASGLGVGELARRSSVAVAGCFAAGVTGGAFWGMAPVYLTLVGHAQGQVALFMFAAIVGGMLARLPVGRFSDGRDRRRVLSAVSLPAAVAAAVVTAAGFAAFGALAAAGFVFGATMFPVYGLSVARAHDELAPEQALDATRGLLIVFGVGAAFGPFAAGLAMSALGPWALFAWVSLVFALLAAYSAHRLRVSEAIPPERQSHFVAVMATTQEALEMAEAQACDAPPAGARPSQ
ncbi:MAG: MFS transporter [Burkholderiales bacterium]|nr:MFS transporter [Burkholderiales bacterium]